MHSPSSVGPRVVSRRNGIVYPRRVGPTPGAHPYCFQDGDGSANPRTPDIVPK